VKGETMSAPQPATQEPGAAIVRQPEGVLTPRGIVPRNFNELWSFARVVAGSRLAPRGLESAEAVFVAVETGLELGFSPIQALSSIAVVNGRATLLGMAAKALVLGSGVCERWTEEALHVTVEEEEHLPDGVFGFRVRSKRVGLEDWTESTFTLADARRAGLWPGKADSNWAKYPARMLKMRAVGFVARDLYPDVLKGLHLAEEMEGTEPEPAAPPSNVARLKDRLAEPIEDPRFEPPTYVETVTPDPGSIDIETISGNAVDAETVEPGDGLTDEELAQLLPKKTGNWHRTCQKLLADGIVALGSARAYYKAALFVFGSHGATAADEITPADRKDVQAEIEAAFAQAVKP